MEVLFLIQEIWCQHCTRNRNKNSSRKGRKTNTANQIIAIKICRSFKYSKTYNVCRVQPFTRAKREALINSEALINIYSLHKQNIKSANAKPWHNKKIGPISKETTLYVQHTSFVHFFAVILHDYDVKLPETS